MPCIGVMGSLVVRALDSTPEGLDSMPNPIKYYPSVHGIRVNGSESPLSDYSRNPLCRVLENISLPLVYTQIGEIGGVAIYRVEVQPVSGSENFPSFSSGGTR
ncbi:hypothetical protein TNCV_2365371 [Trichonephila clavipes]|nr:hypothetical protein TNCV_2365371 [Trichonephila clavipes]